MKIREPRISVVILNYNGMRFLESCIKSLLNSTYRDFEIVVVDNGSSDGSIEHIRKSFSNEPRLKTVLLNKNYGFAAGNDIGYKNTNSSSEFIFFLNNDTDVEKDCLEKILKVMTEDPSIGAAQPKIRTMKCREKIDAVGGVIDYYGRAWHLGFNEYDYGQYDSVSEVFYAQGAAIVVRKSVVEKIGLFDPVYFLYYEETDLCWRMWLAGYRVVVIPEAIVYHYGGGSTISTDSYRKNYLKLFHARKNQIMTMLKNYSLSNILKYTLPFALLMLLTAVKWSIAGEKASARAYYSAFLWIFSHSGLIIRRRMFVQKIRRISDEELIRKMKLRRLALLISDVGT